MNRGEKAGITFAAAFVGFLVGAAIASLFVSDECGPSLDVVGDCEVQAAGEEWRLLIGGVPTAILFGAIAFALLRRHRDRFAHRYTNQS